MLALALQAMLISAPGIGTALLPLPAHAQAPDGDPAAATALPQGEAVRSFDIPAGPLDAALDRFARVAGVNLSYDATLVAERDSPGLQGHYSTEAGLLRLLEGSGLAPLAQPGGGYSLHRAARPTAPASGDAHPRGDTALPQVTVTAVAERSDGRTMAYAGGQVARGGRVGLLGDLDFMDSPFSQTAYTAEMAENLQAQMIADVLVNDPSVRDSGRKYGQASNAFMIRGFSYGSFDVSFNGLQSIFPAYRQPVEALERIEVLKGPNALLNGMSGSIGGDVNLVPKRAADEPLTRLGLGYMSDREFTTHLDAGRRFGPANAWGIRVNAVNRNGDTPVDEQSGNLAMGSAALDYRGSRLRMALDVIGQRQRIRNVSPFTYAFAGAGIPRPPQSTDAILLGGLARHNEAMAAFRAEYDFSDTTSGYVTFGRKRQRSDVVTTGIASVQSNGDYRSTLSTDAYGVDTAAVKAGIDKTLVTGGIRHKLAFSADFWRQRGLERTSGRVTAGPQVDGNIYTPLVGRLPDVPTWGDWRASGSTYRKSVAVADTLSFLDERVRLTLGMRKQFVESTYSGGYKENALTPMVGLVLKPREDLSLYANYVEGLLQGFMVNDATSPDNGSVFPPYKTRQYEIGLKRDFGDLATTLSLYQIAQPSQLMDPNTRSYSQDGEQRNRGIEWNVFGRLSPHLGIIGGVSYVQARLTNTAGQSNDGNRAPGVPKLLANLGLEWTAPSAPALTLSGRAIRTGPAYLNATNTQQVGGWTRYDLGARYTGRVAGRAVTLRGNLENVFGKAYWIAVNGGAALSTPRTVFVSATIDF